MKISPQMTDDAVLRLIGERLAQVRLARNLTQAQLAEQAGLGLRTVQRLELGAAATLLSGFIRVCRVLDLLERVESFLPEPTPSPMAQLKLQGHRRQRATGRKQRKATARKGGPSKQAGKWTWGDPA